MIERATVSLSEVFTNADYKTVCTALISAKGWIDVSALLVSGSGPGMQAVLSISGPGFSEWQPIGANVDVVPGSTTATALMGSVQVPAGTYEVSIRINAITPDAWLLPVAGTYLRASTDSG